MTQPEKEGGDDQEAEPDEAVELTQFPYAQQHRGQGRLTAGNKLLEGQGQQSQSALGEYADKQTAGQQRSHGAEQKQRRLMRLLGRQTAGAAQQNNPGQAGKGQHGQRTDQAEQTDQQQREQTAETGIQHALLQQTQIDEPFTHQAVEGRQGGDGQTAAEHEAARPGHALEQAAELIHIPRSRGMQNAAGAQKEQPLEQGMIPDVQQAAGKSEEGQRGMPVGLREKAQAQAEKDDPHILNGRVGQTPFDIPLEIGQDNAIEGAGATQGHEHDAGQRQRRWQKAAGAQDAVDPHFHQHSRHQGRHMAGSGGMGIGQPDMQGKETGLDAEAGQGGDKQQAGRLG